MHGFLLGWPGARLVGTPVALNEYYVEVPAGALSVGFIEARSRQPLLPLRIFASRNRTGVYLILAGELAGPLAASECDRNRSVIFTRTG